MLRGLTMKCRLKSCLTTECSLFIVIIFIRDHQRLIQTLLQALLQSLSLTLFSIIFFSKHMTNWILLQCLASVWRWTFLFVFFSNSCPLIEPLTFSHLNHQCATPSYILGSYVELYRSTQWFLYCFFFNL